jgi:Spirocyclase AveC-like
MAITAAGGPSSRTTETTAMGDDLERPGGRASKVIIIWAGIGASFVLWQLWIYGSWLASGPEQITRFRTPGSTTWWWAQITQWGLLLIAIGTVIYVGRRCWRERQLTTEAMLMIGILSNWWQDPLYNYFRPGFFFNSNLINLESWISHIPGVVTPYANLQPEAIVWGFAGYLGVFAAQVLIMVWLMRKMRDRWPKLGGFTLFGIVAALAFVMDAAFEMPMIHTRMYAYPAAWSHLALWGGTPFQLPWLHFAGGALFYAGCAALLVFRDDRGLTVVERGAAGIRSTWRRTTARVLAFVAFVNLVSLAYFPLVELQILHTDPFPQGFESAQVNGLCGNDGQPYGPCPAPGVSIKVVAPGAGTPHPSEIYRQFPYFQTPEGGASD